MWGRRPPSAAAWQTGGARYTRDAVQQMSAYLWPYPYPQMTSMEGVLSSGGMEYPMVTLMQPWADTLSLAGDLMHETGHMWFPMQVGSNETRYPWMDEGLTQFNAAQGMRVLYGEPRTGGRPNDSEAGQRALAAHAWPEGQTLRVRMGIHTSEATATDEGYVGIGVHRGARICAAGHGGPAQHRDRPPPADRCREHRRGPTLLCR